MTRHPSPNPSALATLWLGVALSFSQGLRRHFSPRDVLIGVAALVLMVGVQSVILFADRSRLSAADAYLVFTGVMVLNLVLPFASLITALGLLGGEIEQGTLVYLLVRPCPRIAILLGRVLAAATVTWLLATAMFLACHTVARLLASLHGDVRPPLPTPGLTCHLIVVAALGAWAFTVLYATLVLYLRRPLVALLFGVGHALVWEGIIAFMPGSIGGYTFTQNLNALFFDRPDIGVRPRAVLFRDLQAVPPAADAVVFLIACSLFCIFLAWYRFRGREIAGDN
jgi:ABC-type transport system involved in multi-copper enzyme maturation permease subunit